MADWFGDEELEKEMISAERKFLVGKGFHDIYGWSVGICVQENPLGTLEVTVDSDYIPLPDITFSLMLAVERIFGHTNFSLSTDHESYTTAISDVTMDSITTYKHVWTELPQVGEK